MPKKNTQSKYKKAPGAPRRFKTAYIFFSESKHKEIRRQHANQKLLSTDITKRISQAWNAMSPDEKKPWEELAREDRARYDREKAEYKGPWKMSTAQMKARDCLKRPVSAFVAYSNERRRIVTRHNPNLSAAEISGLLGQMWKHEMPQVRQEYLDRHTQEMIEYRRRYAACGQSAREHNELEPQTSAAPAAACIRLPTVPFVCRNVMEGTKETCMKTIPENASNLSASEWSAGSASNESNGTFFCQIEELCDFLDPWEIFQQKILSNSCVSLTGTIIQQGFVPLTQTDTGCFLTVAAALFEPLDGDELHRI